MSQTKHQLQNSLTWICLLLSSRWILASFIFQPWRWRRYVRLKRRWLSTDYAELYPRRQNSSKPPMWELQILHSLTWFIILLNTVKWVLWHVDPLLGNDSVNTSPRQRIREQQSGSFHFYTTHCKYNNRRCFLCGLHISIAGQRMCFLWVRLEQSSRKSEVSRRNSPRQSKKKGSAEDWLWFIVIDCD
jgi:hypothetical protein